VVKYLVYLVILFLNEMWECSWPRQYITQNTAHSNSRDKGIFYCLCNTALLRYLPTKTHATIDL